MKTYEDIVDLLQDAYEHSATLSYGGSEWVINAHDIIGTLIDSFVEDDYRVFLDVLDAAYDDMEGIPIGKEKDLLRQVIRELAQYEH